MSFRVNSICRDYVNIDQCKSFKNSTNANSFKSGSKWWSCPRFYCYSWMLPHKSNWKSDLNLENRLRLKDIYLYKYFNHHMYKRRNWLSRVTVQYEQYENMNWIELNYSLNDKERPQKLNILVESSYKSAVRLQYCLSRTFS